MLLFKHMQVWLRHVSLDHPYFPSVVYTQERTEQILKLHFWKTLTERETLPEFFSLSIHASTNGSCLCDRYLICSFFVFLVTHF